MIPHFFGRNDTTNAAGSLMPMFWRFSGMVIGRGMVAVRGAVLAQDVLAYISA